MFWIIWIKRTVGRMKYSLAKCCLMHVFYRSVTSVVAGGGSSAPQSGISWTAHRGKIFIFAGKKLPQLEFCTVSLIFAVIFSWKDLDSSQSKGNYLSGALCYWLGIKIVKTFTMCYELSQLFDHFIFFIERKGGLREATWLSRVSQSEKWIKHVDTDRYRCAIMETIFNVQ